MTTVHNTGRTPIGLPDGTVVPAGGSADAKDWDKVSKRKNIAYYVDAKVLTVSEAVAKKAEKQAEEKTADDAAQKNDADAQSAAPARTGAPGAPPAAPKR